MSTVPEIYQTGMKHLAGADLLVDFSNVEAVDSSAVSMLLAWTRAAQKQGRNLQVENMPDGLKSLAHLYGVDAMLAA